MSADLQGSASQRILLQDTYSQPLGPVLSVWTRRKRTVLRVSYMAMWDAFHIRPHLSEAENLGLSVQQSTAQERHLPRESASTRSSHLAHGSTNTPSSIDDPSDSRQSLTASLDQLLATQVCRNSGANHIGWSTNKKP